MWKKRLLMFEQSQVALFVTKEWFQTLSSGNLLNFIVAQAYLEVQMWKKRLLMYEQSQVALFVIKKFSAKCAV